MPALVDLVSSQLAVHPEAPVERIVFGSVDAADIASSLNEWSQDVLGSKIVGSWLWAVSVGCVAGLKLSNGRRVVVKAYAPDRDLARLEAVLAVQRVAVEAGLPAARPLTVPTRLGLGWAVAEESLNVGRPPDMRRPEERLVAAYGWTRLVEILSREDPTLFGRALDTRGSARVVDGLYPLPHSPLFDFEATGDLFFAEVARPDQQHPWLRSSACCEDRVGIAGVSGPWRAVPWRGFASGWSGREWSSGKL